MNHTGHNSIFDFVLLWVVSGIKGRKESGAHALTVLKTDTQWVVDCRTWMYYDDSWTGALWAIGTYQGGLNLPSRHELG